MVVKLVVLVVLVVLMRLFLVCSVVMWLVMVFVF